MVTNNRGAPGSNVPAFFHTQILLRTYSKRHTITTRLFVAPQISSGNEESPNEDKLKPWRDKSVARKRMIELDYQLRAVPATCGLAVTLLIIAGCWAGFSVPVLFFIILFTILGAICFWLDNTD